MAPTWEGSAVNNDWSPWNGGWNWNDPATYFGLIGGGIAGGLGAQWMFGTEGVLAGGAPLNISLGSAFDNIGAAFANISIGGGSGVTLEGVGYVTAAGGGAYVTGNALNNWLNGGGDNVSSSSSMPMPSSKFRRGDLGADDYLTQIQYTLSYAERFGTGKLTQELFDFDNASENFELTTTFGQPSYWQNRNFNDIGIKIVLYEDVSYGGLRFYSHGKGKSFPMSNFNLRPENFPLTNIYGKSVEYPFAITIDGHSGNRPTGMGRIWFRDYDNLMQWYQRIRSVPPSNYWNH